MSDLGGVATLADDRVETGETAKTVDTFVQAVQPEPLTQWSLAARIAFRFFFCYFTLFCFFTQILGGLLSIPKVDIPDLASTVWVRPVFLWTAKHVFGISQTLVFSDSGSGDKTFDWVMAFCFVVIAAVATAVWSVLDRRRLSYPGMLKWFSVALRFALGSQMITYGIVKLFPMQMPYPPLTRLLEPYGQFSPMGVLWYSIGASPAYERICGSAELLAGILLFIPRTAMLGALVTAGVTSEIFILNMTYDVPVKQLSFHLLLMASFLAAPEFSRLANFFFRDRAVERSSQPLLFRSRRANRIAVVTQLVFAAWILGTNVYAGWSQWPVWGGAQPKSPLYGIWGVEKLVIDGHERSPLLGDYGRWRRLIFDYPERLQYQRIDDSFGGYDVAVDTKSQTLALTSDKDKKWKGTLHYVRPAEGKMTLDGDMGGHPTHVDLQLEDRAKIPLVGRGFHWVQEYPFNR
jgi:uncharacterized membrane protein YphA (DoxX/SURF4 family)